MNEVLLVGSVVNSFDKMEKLIVAGIPAESLFGHSVSVNSDGTYAAIGAMGQDSNTGAVYIYVLVNSVWTFQAKLEASDKVQGDMFGCSVSISSDGATVVVGAERKASGRGAVYVFTRTGSSWSQFSKILASDGTDSDYFGNSVSISGDGNYIAAGAIYEDDPGQANNRGAVYIFNKVSNVWSQQRKIMPAESAANSNSLVGCSVSISFDGSVCVMGSFGASVDSLPYAGCAYIYTRIGTTWTQKVRLTNPSPSTYAYFGTSVSVSGDGSTVVVGCNCDDDLGVDSGSAYIYTLSNNVWIWTKITAPSGATSDHFGVSVAASYDGRTVLIGAEGTDSTLSNVGAAYIYVGEGSGWNMFKKLTPSSAGADDSFGYGVSLSGDGSTALIGSRGSDVVANNGGSAYIFS